jgi:aminodeoxychorismate lyase
MIAFLNGAWLPEESATISIFDRSFRYGDGLFEAILVTNGKPFRWHQHMARLAASAAFFQIPLPFAQDELRTITSELVARNAVFEAIVRIQLSRGPGPRGYAPSGNEKPTVVMTLHAAPPRPALHPWSLCFSAWRVAASDPLATHKTSSRIAHVLIAMEAKQRGVDECLILNTKDEIAEAGSCNVFWIRDGHVLTPPISAGALPGVTRAVVLECCQSLGIPHGEENLAAERLLKQDGVFLSLTSRGVVEADTIEGHRLPRSLVTQQLQAEVEKRIASECG